ncbi:DoxX family membrane protein [Desulfoprunum benzoelyticum]|uniref:Methylamine utilisation protein MauE domain-containing protein n=1 Tax=Desulfoprunum benzoelyticum TaxID=1506996 RepID=A0A840UP32_9BACT|nr:MauE/DoxX family redox-associated membrane protein [Desulfoprunum benzoelyticum]MBB5348017.1 hypothetical protein [Desulfoprunum benzoelyticum]MBM9530429.1 DoxX family membrane protein [Desulfoprunum benzoelyticum]
MVKTDESVGWCPGTAGFRLPVLEFGVRLVLGGIFIYSGVIKLMGPAAFAEIIGGFGLLPDALVLPAAVILPLAELAAGVGLLFAIRGSLSAITVMLVLFIAVLGYGIHLGLDIDCGCFGPEDPEQAYKSLRTALARDAVMMAAVAFVYWSRDRGRLRAGRLER